MLPELCITQQWCDWDVLTAQQGPPSQDRQNGQKRGAAEKQRSADFSSVQAIAGNCWHSVPSRIEMDGCSAPAIPAWSASTLALGCGFCVGFPDLGLALAGPPAIATWLGGAALCALGSVGTGGFAACAAALELTSIVRMWPCHCLGDQVSQGSYGSVHK